MYSHIYMQMYTYTQIKNYKVYIYTKKNVKELKNEVKRNLFGKNDLVTLRTDS